MADLMLALPEILVVPRSPDLHSCLLCLQGAERKIRDEERKQSKRKGKCVGLGSQRMLGCGCVLPATAWTLQSTGWMGERLTWRAPAPRPPQQLWRRAELQTMSWVGSGLFGFWV